MIPAAPAPRLTEDRLVGTWDYVLPRSDMEGILIIKKDGTFTDTFIVGGRRSTPTTVEGVWTYDHEERYLFLDGQYPSVKWGIVFVHITWHPDRYIQNNGMCRKRPK
jgi:hypothetical protein